MTLLRKDIDCIAITGLAGSGKGRIREVLKKLLPEWYLAPDLSAELLRLVEQKHNLTSGALEDYQLKQKYTPIISKLSADLRVEDPPCLIKRNYEQTPKTRVVLFGVRTNADFKFLTQREGTLILEVYASDQIRKSRFEEPEEFDRRNYESLEMELRGNLSKVEVRIRNEGTDEDLLCNTVEALRGRAPLIGGFNWAPASRIHHEEGYRKYLKQTGG